MTGQTRADLWARMKPPIAVAIVALAAFLLYRTLNQTSFAEIWAAAQKISARRLALTLACVAGSYFCITFFDFLAMRYIRKPMPWRRTALAAFTALSVGQNIGFAGAGSSAIRYRFYTRWGLTLGDVAKVVLFSGVTVGLGLATMAGIAVLLRPDLAASITTLSPEVARLIGAACLCVAATYIALAAVMTGPVRLRRWSLEMPPLRIATLQIAVGTCNFACVAGALYNALADITAAPYLTVAAAYVIANLAALVSHVPGGLGVIESVVTMLLPGGQTLAAVLVFRAAYYLVPLPLGAILFAISELYWRRRDHERARTMSEPD